MASTQSLHFKIPYLRQSWSLPDSIIYYITKNPSNAKAWQKLIQSCKYFFAKNAVLVVDELYYDCYDKKWHVVLFRVKNSERTIFSKSINFKSVLCKIWLTKEFFMSSAPSNLAQPSNLVSSIIPYVYRCDIKKSQICNQKITYDQFKFIFSKAKIVDLCDFAVRNNNDEIVPFEKLVKALTEAESFLFMDKPDSSCITTSTAKELFEFPHFSKISQMEIYGIPETFDIEAFYTYLKKNKHTKFRIYFRDTISQTYKNRLEEIIDEIIVTKNHDYKIPDIYFEELSSEKRLKLYSLCKKK